MFIRRYTNYYHPRLLLLMIHKETLVGLEIDLLMNIYVNRVENILKVFKMHMCELKFDSHFLGLLIV